VFAAEEAPALLPLPQVPFELAAWSPPKVAPDARAKVGFAAPIAQIRTVP
jgi:hypothetical protein